MTYIVERKRRKKKTNDHSDILYLMCSVKRSFKDDQRLSSCKNNGQGNKMRTYSSDVTIY